MSENYQKEVDKKNTEKINEILSALPSFAKDYFSSRRANTTTRTRLAYAYDIRKFFIWLENNNPEIEKLGVKNIGYDELNNINTQDIEDFVTFLMSSSDDCNDSAGVARKLASLGSFFQYFVKHEVLIKNPCENVDKPKVHNIEIIKLTPEEITTLLDVVQYGSESISQKQEDYLSKTRTRDYTIFTILLSTGIRVSELVGLNCSDVYVKECRIVVRRKGGNIANVYLSDETCDILNDYLVFRKAMRVPESEDALFLSMQNTRIGVQAVENMVKKYSKLAGIEKKITPHKLRKTYGTELYKQTGDIYLVASSLGHSSVATTTKHYAQQDEINKIAARNVIKLNTKEPDA